MFACRSAREEGSARPFVQIIEFEGLKIAHEDVAGSLPFGQGVEVFPRLPVGLCKITALAFLLDEQDARPEEVNVAVGIVKTPHVLLEACYGAATDAEDLEEIVVETLRLASFIRSARPRASEVRRADAHLVPGEAHQIDTLLDACSLKSNFAAPRYPSPSLLRRLILLH